MPAPPPTPTPAREPQPAFLALPGPWQGSRAPTRAWASALGLGLGQGRATSAWPPSRNPDRGCANSSGRGTAASAFLFLFFPLTPPRVASEYSGEWLPPRAGPARGLYWEILEQGEGTSDHVRGREARQVFVSGLPTGPVRAKGGCGVPWTDDIRTCSREKVLHRARADLPCVPRMAMTAQAQG